MSKKEMFSEYPDVVNVKQLCEMLGGIGPKAAYQCLHNGSIGYLKVGKGFLIPKKNVIDFLQKEAV